MNYFKGGFKGGGRGQTHGFGRKKEGFGGKSVNYKTRCSDCGDDCTVPFVPNGSKPVLCSNCFQNKSGDNSGRGYNKKRFGSRPNFTERPGSSNLKGEIKQINRKLDRIIDLLSGGSNQASASFDFDDEEAE